MLIISYQIISYYIISYGMVFRYIVLSYLAILSNTQQSCVPATALYFLFFDVETLVFSTLKCNEQIMKNGSNVAEARMDESGNYTQAHCYILIDLAANDQIKFRNNDATIFYMGGTYGRCNGYLVG